MSDAILERAKQLISKGYTPLPLNGKAPTINGWQEIDPPTISLAEHWRKSGVMHNLGLRTGDCGLVVLDFDGLDGYFAFIDAFPDMTITHTVKTGSGNGMHVYLTINGDLPKSTGQLNVPGGKVEIKAKGRQVVIPPSVHPETHQPYTVSVNNPIKQIASFADIQAWIESHNPKPEYKPPQELPTQPAAGSKSEYAKQTLANLAAQLAGITEGGRNNACNRMAWKLAHFVRMGDLSEAEVYNALRGAMFSNGSTVSLADENAFEKTFRSGFQDGFGDTSFIPEVYRRQQTDWQSQRKPAKAMPGQQAYNPPPKSENGIVTVGRTRIIQRRALFDDLSDRIQDDEYIPEHPPIIFPLQCLHHLGGQAHVTHAGKIIVAAGASGSGKTSFLETVADAYAARGIPAAIWSPEWTPDELAERAIQRHGGVSQDALYLHEIDKYRTGKLNQASNPLYRLSDDQRANSSAAIRTLRSWKEDVYFIDNSLLSVDELSEVIADAKQVMAFPRVLICDYAQMLKANDVEQEDSGMYALVQRFKNVCIRYGLVGWLATQTTKAEAKANIKDGEFLGTTVINCTKNSRGKKGKVRVVSDPARLRIIDQAHPNQTFSKDDHHLGSQAGRWLNDDAANLWLSINPEYRGE